MPTTDIDAHFKVPTGSHTASGEMVRMYDETVTLHEIQKVFGRARKAFREEYGREPNWDNVNFLGGTTTSEILFEIVEME